jgi:murein DD-endopeptidase MepM/ murein hydrolase activator NlpD
MPGTIAASSRTDVTDYQIEPGDSLSSIAYEFGVSVGTVMWENNLSLRSILKPGMVLKIPPVTGVMHTVKKGDTLKKIASTYDAKVEDIIAFNHLEENGSDLKTGERIVVPNGSRTTVAVAPTKKPIISQSSVRRPAPPNSLALPSISGFVWPTGSHIITQYYGLKHHALDIGGAWQTPIYATKSGTVVVSQCGWNSGYGCYIIIDHGDGVRSLYGHNSQLLVSVGDYVETGQTIALMGNTGKVRGVTGIHSHFEIQVKGGRVNPLKYVR